MKNFIYDLKYKILNLWATTVGKIAIIGGAILVVLVIVLIANNTTRATTDDSTTAIAINDYNGCENRIEAVKGDVTDFMASVMERNQEIKSENPSNYWSDDTFQEFLTDAVDLSTFTHTAYYNELQTSWEDVEGYVGQTFEDGADYTLIRHDKDDYELKYTTSQTSDAINSYWLQDEDSLTLDHTILSNYSSNNDWLQNVHYVTGNTFIDDEDNQERINSELFEYGHYTNGDKEYVIIQTTYERLIVEYTITKICTDESVTEQKDISMLAYSKLDGETRASVTDDKVYNEYEQDKDIFVNGAVTEAGYVRDRYNIGESIFTNFNSLSDIDKSWVFGNDYYTQTIYYDGTNVTITSLNKLSKKYQSYAFNKETGEAVEATDNVSVPTISDTSIEVSPTTFEKNGDGDVSSVTINGITYTIAVEDDKTYLTTETEKYLVNSLNIENDELTIKYDTRNILSD